MLSIIITVFSLHTCRYIIAFLGIILSLTCLIKTLAIQHYDISLLSRPPGTTQLGLLTSFIAYMAFILYNTIILLDKHACIILYYTMLIIITNNSTQAGINYTPKHIGRQCAQIGDSH